MTDIDEVKKWAATAPVAELEEAQAHLAAQLSVLGRDGELQTVVYRALRADATGEHVVAAWRDVVAVALKRWNLIDLTGGFHEHLAFDPQGRCEVCGRQAAERRAGL